MAATSSARKVWRRKIMWSLQRRGKQKASVNDKAWREKRKRKRIYLRWSASGVASLATTILSVVKGRRTRRTSRIRQQHPQRQTKYPPNWKNNLPCMQLYLQERGGAISSFSPRVAQRFGQGPSRRASDGVSSWIITLATGAHSIQYQEDQCQLVQSIPKWQLQISYSQMLRSVEQEARWQNQEQHRFPSGQCKG